MFENRGNDGFLTRSGQIQGKKPGFSTREAATSDVRFAKSGKKTVFSIFQTSPNQYFLNYPESAGYEGTPPAGGGQSGRQGCQSQSAACPEIAAALPYQLAEGGFQALGQNRHDGFPYFSIARETAGLVSNIQIPSIPIYCSYISAIPPYLFPIIKRNAPI
ncbi:MAG: hypothetical protein HFE95_07890 [Acutalibacter sp.]|nr:hypothetical protein [Acutalibacter sp.]